MILAGGDVIGYGNDLCKSVGFDTIKPNNCLFSFSTEIIFF